jgi:hypothetical protein
MTRATTLDRYQADVIGLLFRRDPAPHLEALASVAVPSAESARARERWLVYRRMARTRLVDAVEASFPRLVRILGERRRAILEEWFETAPPSTPYLRAVAEEFAGFLRARPDLLEGLPPWTASLAAYEWLLLDVEYNHEEEGAALHAAAELSFEAPAVLTPAHRIVRLPWAVHRVPAEAEAHATASVERFDDGRALCIYRDPATHRARVLELTAIAASILEEVSGSDRSVVESVRAVAERLGFAIDGPFVAAFSELVADLCERGIWLGSRIDAPS